MWLMRLAVCILVAGYTGIAGAVPEATNPPVAQSPRLQSWVRHINSSSTGNPTCGDIDLGALMLDGDPVGLDNKLFLEAYTDATVRFYTDYKLERGSCKDAHFTWPTVSQNVSWPLPAFRMESICEQFCDCGRPGRPCLATTGRCGVCNPRFNAPREIKRWCIVIPDCDQ